MEDKEKYIDVNYWRGFKELYKDPAFEKAKEDEFPNEASSLPVLNGISRRKFLALFAASAAFAAAGCSDYKDKGALVPYNKKPEEIIPGVPNFYASTCTACQNACGILIKTREGRPIKIDGNPDHPVNKGKICAKGQANILNLYDPNRIKEPIEVPTLLSREHEMSKVSWQEVDDDIITRLRAVNNKELDKAISSEPLFGKEIAIITHSVISPSQKKIFDEFIAKYPTTKIYSYELSDDLNIKNAFKKSYGVDYLPVVKLDEAKIILSLESDFLGSEGNYIESARLFTQSRDVISKKDFNRLYVAEGAFSLTGVNADYRLRLRTDAIEEFVMCLLNEFIIKNKISAFANNVAVINFLKNYSLDEFAKKNKLSVNVIKALVEDLKDNTGSSYITAGAKLPESTHIAVNLLNEVLGNSKLYSKESVSQNLIPLSSKSDIENLISKMNSKQVAIVIHFDCNPVYHFSKDYDYLDAMKNVFLTYTLCEEINETAYESYFALPINHNFESWGDYKTRTGVYSLQQPVISPLYNTRQKEAVLLNWLNSGKDSYAENIYLNFIKSNWEKNLYPALNQKIDFKKFWNLALHDGVVKSDEKIPGLGNYKIDAFLGLTQVLKQSNDYVILLKESYFLGDGRFANNGWLQELPDPVAKTVWDNYASISPSTAKSLSIETNDNVEISAGGKKLTLPALVQPGMADGEVVIYLGYGRTKVGEVGINAGFNANTLISKNPKVSDWIYTDGKISKASGKYKIMTTQEHYPIDDKRFNDIQLRRDIIQEGTFEEYKKNPKFLKEEKPAPNLFNIYCEPDYKNVKWGMSIDLNKCIGCHACVSACNVENNIPVVGKDQVEKNREMQWIRIDRYYSGDSENPKANFQPMLCQHCDNAPCENVCPVAATNHSPDGLNQMVYNRCVGTRYCSNNCPYKVRRFNYYNFRDHLKHAYYQQEPVSLLYNPEVTVRSRGVMEKCTFCIQRIMDEKQKAVQENREINGDNVKTACQEGCPADAIHFGDLNKKDSDILKFVNHEIGYRVLEEINVRPNVTYLAKLRNIKAENE